MPIYCLTVFSPHAGILRRRLVPHPNWNRPGVLDDEAVKSLVHINLHYTSLDEDQSLKVFQLEIQRLREIEEQGAQVPGHKKSCSLWRMTSWTLLAS